MKSNYYIIISIFLLIVTAAYGQTGADEEYGDIVLLKSGGVYLDVKIIESIPDDKIVVKNRDGVAIKISFNKIYAVTDKENYPKIRSEFEAVRPKRKESSLSEPEHFFLLGMSSGDGNSNLAAALISGYYLKNFYAGAGLGWDDRRDGGYISLLVDARFYSGFGRTKSYIYTEIGFFGGSRVGLGFGLKIPWGEPANILIQGGFRRQGNPDGDSYSAGVGMIGLTFKL